jgi:Tfp pilus assembly protein PilE
MDTCPFHSRQEHTVKLLPHTQLGKARSEQAQYRTSQPDNMNPAKPYDTAIIDKKLGVMFNTMKLDPTYKSIVSHRHRSAEKSGQLHRHPNTRKVHFAQTHHTPDTPAQNTYSSVPSETEVLHLHITQTPNGRAVCIDTRADHENTQTRQTDCTQLTTQQTGFLAALLTVTAAVTLPGTPPTIETLAFMITIILAIATLTNIITALIIIFR